MCEMRVYAKAHNLKPSFCYYKQWGIKKKIGQRKPVVPLRFSKIRKPEIGRSYATHFVDSRRIAELKAVAVPEPVPDTIEWPSAVTIFTDGRRCCFSNLDKE
jgi:hypothetical protein